MMNAVLRPATKIWSDLEPQQNDQCVVNLSQTPHYCAPCFFPQHSHHDRNSIFNKNILAYYAFSLLSKTDETATLAVSHDGHVTELSEHYYTGFAPFQINDGRSDTNISQLCFSLRHVTFFFDETEHVWYAIFSKRMTVISLMHQI